MEVLQEYGVKASLLRAIQSLYTQSESCVQVFDSKLDSFTVGVGLHKGCPLSAILFVISWQDPEAQSWGWRVAVQCEAAEMRISTSKSEAMDLARKPVDYPLKGMVTQSERVQVSRDLLQE